MRKNPSLFPVSEGYGSSLKMVQPEAIPHIAGSLLTRGYGANDVAKVLGKNFLRVARTTWPARLPLALAGAGT